MLPLFDFSIEENAARRKWKYDDPKFDCADWTPEAAKKRLRTGSQVKFLFKVEQKRCSRVHERFMNMFKFLSSVFEQFMNRFKFLSSVHEQFMNMFKKRKKLEHQPLNFIASWNFEIVVMTNPEASNFLTKTSALSVNLNLDGVPIASNSHTHPSHSESSRLLTSSLSSIPGDHCLSRTVWDKIRGNQT